MVVPQACAVYLEFTRFPIVKSNIIITPFGNHEHLKRNY